MFGKRGQLIWERLMPWIIGVIVLVIVLGLYFILSGKGGAALDYLRDLFRFGG